ESFIRGPYDYLKNKPGKELRTLLIAKFNNLLKVEPASALSLVESIVDILHTASLLIDDVEDSANLRRGSPVSHAIFGVPMTINSSNYMYFIAMFQCLQLSNSSNKIFIEEMINLHRGQGLDLYWRESLICPTEQEYIDMVMNKTGGLFRLAVRLLQEQSKLKVDLVPFANLLGIIYQIRDDYCNLTTYSKNKGYCEDITEGKFSFPVVHAINSGENGNKELMNILKLRTESEDLKKYVVEEILQKKTNSFKYCEDTLNTL
ncbi:hypothetical protein PACTADRAFT_28939, partial [Pachysolen tannophilus NRRL Y-2460]